MAKKNAETDRRRKIEEIRKKERALEKRKNVLTVVLTLLAGTALIVFVGIGLGGDGGEKSIDSYGVAASEAACAVVENADPIPPASNHVDKQVNYEVVPPMGGPHFGQTLPAKRFYSRDDNPLPELAVHNQEHGLVIAWYDSKLPEEEVDILEDLAESIPDRFMAVPWTRGDFKDDKHFVLTSWGHMQRCGKVSGEAVENFWEEFKDHKDAPERGAGVLPAGASM